MNVIPTPVTENTSQPTLKKYTLPRLRSWLHIAQVCFTILSVCLIAPVIAIQLKYQGGSAAGPNYVLFVAIFTFVIPICLVVFPWMYESKNKFKRCGKFFLKPRTNVIFTGFYSLLWLTAGIAVTTYAVNPDSCKLDSSIKKDGYNSAWPAQCNCAKVATVLVWITCLLWVTTLIMALVVFWKQKQLVQQNLQHIGKSKQDAMELMGDDDMNEKTDISDIDNNNNNQQQHEIYAQQQQEQEQQQQQQQQQQQPPSVMHHNSHAIVENVTEPSYYSNQSYQQPSSITPTQQQEYYSDPVMSQQHQPLLPLAVMPEPQHYKQQHAFV